MAAFREVSVRLADGSTEVGYFKERPPGEPSALEIGVEVFVGQRVSFIGSNSEFEVANVSWQRMAQWCHVDLIPPRPRRLAGPKAAPVEPSMVTSEAEPSPAPVVPEPEPLVADAADEQEQEQEDNSDGE